MASVARIAFSAHMNESRVQSVRFKIRDRGGHRGKMGEVGATRAEPRREAQLIVCATIEAYMVYLAAGDALTSARRLFALCPAADPSDFDLNLCTSCRRRHRGLTPSFPRNCETTRFVNSSILV